MEFASRYCRPCRARTPHSGETRSIMHCDVCVAAAERATSADQADAAAGLDPLEGTDKQVSWASTIRRRAFGHIAAQRCEGPAVAGLRAQPFASWWIDHRETFATAWGVATWINRVNAEQHVTREAPAKGDHHGRT